jgi:uncharacterized protein
MCAVTRVVRPVDELIRFVAAPDGTVVPDLKRRLPGRGVWITADAASVAEAVRRKAFSRGLKAQVVAGGDLGPHVERLLEKAALDMLSMANKAGRVITGFAKVETSIARGDAVALLHARDAGSDGKRKLAQVAHRVTGGAGLPADDSFTGAQMDLALGRQNVVHAALLAGPVSDALLARISDLARYRTGTGSPGPVKADTTGQPAETEDR